MVIENLDARKEKRLLSKYVKSKIPFSEFILV
jgi:hypothetical protein